MAAQHESSSLICVSAAAHPFRAATVDLEIGAGPTIAELLELAQPDPILRAHAHVFIDDWLVPRHHWHRVRPRGGCVVSIKVVPQGGGGGDKNPLRTVLTIGVLVGTLAFAAPLGAAIVGAEAFTVAGISIASSAVGGALIATGGMLLVNAIAPIRPPSLDNSRAQNPAESPSYFLEQARNQFRPYAPVPVVFGKHRVVPPLGAQPYTEVLGSNNHLRMIVVWSYGPAQVSDIKIGDTPIEDFDDVTVETREGRDTDDDITVYPASVDQQDLSIELDSAAGWVTRRSADDADELSVDIALPRGLAKFNDEGEKITNGVIVQVQYRLVGTTDWVAATGRGVDVGGSQLGGNASYTAKGFAQAIYIVAAKAVERLTFTSGWVQNATTGQIRFRGARTQPIRHGVRWKTPVRGQYDVRVQRVSADESSDRSFSDTAWVALRSFTDEPPIDFPENLCVTAIDIRATGQISGALDRLSGIVEAEMLDWDGSDWSAAYTRNPASAFRHALQHPGRRIATPDDEIDLEALQGFHEFCDDNNYTFDHILDVRRSIWDLLSDICAVARASPAHVDGKWTVIVDDGAQSRVQHFSAVNASRFEVSRAFTPPPHGVRVTFPNEDEDWNRDERIIYSDDYDDSNATLVPTINPVGLTDPDHVWRFGRFHLAQLLLRREVWRFVVSFEYLVAQRGSRVTVQHDVLAVGIASARISELHMNLSGDITSISIRPAIQLPEDVTYAAKIRTVDDAHIVATLSNTGGTDTDPADRLMFSTALDETLQVGGVVSVGEQGRATIDGLVTAIKPAGNLTASLEVVPYQEDIYDAETGSIPAFDSKLSSTIYRLTLTVQEVTSDGSVVRLIADAYEPGIRVKVIPVQNDEAWIECEIRPHDTGEPYRPAEVRYRASDSVEVGDVDINQEYDLRVRWRAPGLLPGPWVEIEGQEVTGSVGPPAPTNFLVDILGDGTRRFRFLPPLIRSFAGVQLRYGEGQSDEFDDMTELHKGLITDDHYETVEPQRAGSYRFACRSVDTEGLTSDPVYILADIGPTRTGDVLYWRCPSAEGWPGAFTNAERTTDGLDALVGLPDYTWADLPSTWAAWTSWAGGDGTDYQTEMTYTAPVVDLGFTADVTVQWQGDTDGTVIVEYRASEDDDDPSGGWTEVSPSTPFSAQKIEVRWTLTGDGTTLLFLDHLCFSINAPSATEFFRDVNTSTWAGSASAGREIPSGLDTVTDVDLVLQNVGAGYSWEITSKDPPTIKIYDGSDTAVDAVVDATVRGVRLQ